jgi:hypothetical protein
LPRRWRSRLPMLKCAICHSPLDWQCEPMER